MDAANKVAKEHGPPSGGRAPDRKEHELYGCKGCGSAVIEVMLEWADVAYPRLEVAPWKDSAATEAFQRINPLAQIPTLRLADASVLTETAAMIVLLDELHPGARLLPPIGDPARTQALRWIVFFAANMYPAVSVADFPERWITGAEAQKALKQGSVERMRHYWKIVERTLEPAPYLVGRNMTALDVYAAMFSRWGPGRSWIDANCPNVAAALALTEQDPVVQRVWKRNF